MAKRSTYKRVALLVESTRTYARGVILGISRFNRELGLWHLEYQPHETSRDLLRQLDGIIARVDNRELFDRLVALDIPVVDLRRRFSHDRIPQVGPDNRAIVQLIFQHFRQRGFYTFAFLGYRGHAATPHFQRATYFQELVTASGFECRMLALGRESEHRLGPASLRRLQKWLLALPEQTALVTCNDDMGLLALQTCRSVGRSVPDSVAVAGIGNDDCLCGVSLPPLTSVDVNAERCGYEAAALLHRMMTGNCHPGHSTLIEPRRIAMRASSDTTATADARLRQAARFIHENAKLGITPRDVVRHARLSRVALENRFKSSLGRTINEEITQVRLDAVRELLVTTDLSVREIATEAGFEYPEYMMRLFRKATGKTPTEYRQNYWPR
ncbi:MAG: DNA-binding transcriptional regulator [Planctomycetia bacterium]|nr:DNA-binding transcriptional regulator [Planctomycetia bacterium]